MTERTMKERILDGVEQCFEINGVQKTTLQDVADQVGVSRMTVYRHFKDRQSLFDGAVLRNISHHWRLISARLSDIERLDEWLIEALTIYQLELCQDPSVKLYDRLNAYDQGFIVALSKPGLAVISDKFQPLFDALATDNRLANGLDKNDLAEWVHRLNFSLLKHPSPRFLQEQPLRRWLAAQLSDGLIPSTKT